MDDERKNLNSLRGNRHVKFFLPLKPFSINSMYYRDRSKKTAAAQDWESRMLFELAKPVPQVRMREIRESFDVQKHAFLLTLTFLFPEDELINAQGTISSRAFDLTNIEKPIVDLLFLPRYHKETPNVNADDKHIVSIQSRKRISPDDKHWIGVSIAVIDLACLKPKRSVK